MTKDWTKIYQKYKGLWIALQEDEETVIASGESARKALEGAYAKGHRDPILTRIPEKLMAYIGSW